MRYLPLSDHDRKEMCAFVGVKTQEELFQDIPSNVLLKGPLESLPFHQSEWDVEKFISGLALKNSTVQDHACFLGGGAYYHHVPATVDHLIQRGEFLTSYTPYQPEITQGTLQSLFEFQTQVCLLTGMEVANASMYDGASAAAEAVMMANRITKRKKALVSGGVHPHYVQVIDTHARFSGFEVVHQAPDLMGNEDLIPLLDESYSCVVIQSPSFFGHLLDITALAEKAHALGIMVIFVVTEIISLGLLPSPGSMGADIVVGEGQSIGNPLQFGGPYVGLFATREKFIRQMPGRLCGETVDRDGKRGWVLTLSTREQHIRREKATSNICTNSGLCALAFTIHLTLLGEVGLKRLAKLNHAHAVQLVQKLFGFKVLNSSFFNEFTIELPKNASEVVEALLAKKIFAGVPLSRFYPQYPNHLVVAVTEMNDETQMDHFVTELKACL